MFGVPTRLSTIIHECSRIQLCGYAAANPQFRCISIRLCRSTTWVGSSFEAELSCSNFPVILEAAVHACLFYNRDTKIRETGFWPEETRPDAAEEGEREREEAEGILDADRSVEAALLRAM